MPWPSGPRNCGQSSAAARIAATQRHSVAAKPSTHVLRMAASIGLARVLPPAGVVYGIGCLASHMLVDRRTLLTRGPSLPRTSPTTADVWLRVHRVAMACRFEVLLSGE